jgi:hypothetical protein
VRSMFRLVIRLYPAAHRAAHGDEIMSTARDSLESQGPLGVLRELADLTVHALRERTRLTATSAVGAVATAAAPLAAGSAVALSLVFLAFAEWTSGGLGHPFATLGAIPYLAWLLVFLSAVVKRAGAARRLAGSPQPCRSRSFRSPKSPTWTGRGSPCSGPWRCSG